MLTERSGFFPAVLPGSFSVIPNHLPGGKDRSLHADPAVAKAALIPFPGFAGTGKAGAHSAAHPLFQGDFPGNFMCPNNPAELFQHHPGAAAVNTGKGFGLRVFIEIEDSGRGISPEIRQRIFEPFFSTKIRGTGLGLAISYEILKAQDGRLGLSEPQHGSGACFEIVLPIKGKNGHRKNPGSR